MRQPWRKVGGLFVPAAAAPAPAAQRPLATPRGVAFCSGYEELYDQTVSEKEVIAHLRRFKRAECLCTLSKIGITLEERGSFDRTVQRDLVSNLGDAEFQGRVQRLRADERIIFFELQLLNAVKLVILHCSNQPRRRFTSQREAQAFLRTLTMISSLVAKTDAAAIPLSLAARNLPFHSPEDFRYLAARYWELFRVLPSDPRLAGSVNTMDIEQAFRRATGVDLLTYMCAGMALVTHLSETNYDLNRWFIRARTFFKDTTLGARRGQRMLNLFALPIERMRARLLRETRAARSAYAVITLRQHPLIYARRGYLVCPSLRFLKERFTSGIYWTIADSLPERRRLRFFRYFGELFEEYLSRALKRMIPDGGGLARRLFREFPYPATRGEVRTSDLMVVYGRSAVFFEVNSARLQTQTTVRGDPQAFERDAGKMIIENAKQLARVITDFRQGRFHLGETASRDIDRIYPVIVTLQTFPQLPQIWGWLSHWMAAKGVTLGGTGVRPLQVLDSEEIENLEAIVQNGHSISDVLEAKCSSEYREESFKNFLFYSQQFNRGPGNVYLLDRFEKLLKETHERLALPTPATSAAPVIVDPAEAPA
ncbi:MAG: hypothetical protein HYZ73_01520 [Elusimicrobia bacterium]|nr:hypothetical protein [Elusimicrobiota bacterium]